MVRDGIYYFLGFTAAGALVLALAGGWFAAPLFVVGLFCAWFFRDPERPLPAGPFALSPADGKVVCVVPEDDGRTRISIFLNIFDVHVNRTPISGVITDITYKRGRFMAANREDASSDNEQNIFTVRAADGAVVVFSQIAGLIARRIVCYKSAGDLVQAGERVGLIKFGSRMDVILGPEWRIEVKPGVRVEAGTSVLARRANEVAEVKFAEIELGDVKLGEAVTAIREEPALCRT